MRPLSVIQEKDQTRPVSSSSLAPRPPTLQTTRPVSLPLRPPTLQTPSPPRRESQVAFSPPSNLRKQKKIRKLVASHILTFGKDFQIGLSHTACSIGVLLSRGALMSNGDVDMKSLGRVTKSHLWHYIYYLQHHNRHIEPFRSVLGTSKRVTYSGLLALIGKNKTDRQTLVDLIHGVVIQSEARVPFLKSIVPATDIQTVTVTSPLSPPSAASIAVGPTPDIDALVARVKSEMKRVQLPVEQPAPQHGPPMMIQPVVYPAKMDSSGDVRIKFDLNLAPLNESQLRKLVQTSPVHQQPRRRATPWPGKGKGQAQAQVKA